MRSRVLTRVLHSPGSVFCVQEIARPSLSPLRTTIEVLSSLSCGVVDSEVPKRNARPSEAEPALAKNLFIIDAVLSQFCCGNFALDARRHTRLLRQRHAHSRTRRPRPRPAVSWSFRVHFLHAVPNQLTPAVRRVCEQLWMQLPGALQRLQHPPLVTSVLQLEISTEPQIDNPLHPFRRWHALLFGLCSPFGVSSFFKLISLLGLFGLSSLQHVGFHDALSHFVRFVDRAFVEKCR